MEHDPTESPAAARPGGPKVLVWDLPVRIFHWLLALTVLGAWVTHELGVRYMEWHMRLGYLALGLVLFRIGWGFFGTRHARFGAFLAGPKAVAAYARDWIEGRVGTRAGHNPLGGWAIIAMLASVAIQAVSGLFNTDDILTTGPWRPAVSEAFADRMSAIHSINFDVLTGLIALHLTAISAYWLRSRINLVGPMLTGRKAAAPGAGIDGQRLGIALAVAIAAAMMVAVLIIAAPEPDPAELFF
jgi:cytochrome b